MSPLRRGPRTRARLAAALFVAATALEPAAGEMRTWRLGSDGEDWVQNAKSSSGLDLTASGARMASFDPRRDLIEQLNWAEGSPDDFVTERARAHVWDNAALKKPNQAIVDGDSTTSTGDRFKTFGASQKGTAFFFDLGTRYPLFQVSFYPRQLGADEEGRPFVDDFVRGYEVFVSDGGTYNDQGRPIYTLLRRVDLSSQSVARVDFPVQLVRFIRLNVLTPNPFEIAGFEARSRGFVPRADYLSRVIDLGEAANFTQIQWEERPLESLDGEVAVATRKEGHLEVRMRSGVDDSPQVFYEITNLFTRERRPVTESEYNSLQQVNRGPVEDDQINWSLWSPPYEHSGAPIGLPAPRRYFQISYTMTTPTVLRGMELVSLGVEHVIPPLAQQVLAEISLLEDPFPDGDVAAVPVATTATYALDLRSDLRASDAGFDGLRIATPSRPLFLGLVVGEGGQSITPDSVMESDDALTLLFPSRRITSRQQGVLRVIFQARIFTASTWFQVEILDAAGKEPPQAVQPGDANFAVGTNTLRVLAAEESSGRVLPLFRVVPKSLTPNGDGRNDEAKIELGIAHLVRSAKVSVEVLDLSGRRVQVLFAGRRGSGAWEWSWDGTAEGGGRVPPGIYVMKATARTESQSFARTALVAVAY